MMHVQQLVEGGGGGLIYISWTANSHLLLILNSAVEVVGVLLVEALKGSHTHTQSLVANAIGICFFRSNKNSTRDEDDKVNKDLTSIHVEEGWSQTRAPTHSWTVSLTCDIRCNSNNGANQK